MNLKLTVYKDLLNKLNITEYFYAVNFDVEQEKYVKGLLIVDNINIYIIINKELVKTYRIKDFSSFNMTSTLNGGYLYGKYNGDDLIIVSCSKRYFEKISAVGLGLELYLEEGYMAISEISESHCPICNTPYIKGTQICAYCGHSKGVFKSFLPYIKKYKWLILIQYILLFVSVGISIIRPNIFEKIVDDYLTVAVFDNVFILLIAALALCYVLDFAFRTIRGLINPRIAHSVAHDIRKDVYKKVQGLSLSSASNKTTGGLITRVSNDTMAVQSFISNQLFNAIYYSIEAILLIVIMAVFDPLLTLLILIPIPIVTIITQKLRKRIGAKYERRWKYLSRANNTLHDIINGIKVVKTYGKEEKEVQRFKEANQKLMNVDIQTESFWAIFIPIINFLIVFGAIIIYYYVGNKIIDGEWKFGAMIKWATYSSMLYACARNLTNLPRSYNDFKISANKILEILNEKDDENEGEILDNIKGEIKFEKVRFGYLSFTPVLKDISFTVSQGETIGIVGYSGSGKTTLVNLLMKLYQPNSGKIYVDGIDLSTLDSFEYRRKIGAVLQETFLFNGTIYDNIKYGNKNATYEDVIRVCKMARAHDFILKKPFGYDTKLGNRGDGLSGGEKQRIAIARALLLNPSIFIFDEATSSLDTITEKDIQEEITEISKGKTTFIIAHRLSTLKNANRLIVLNNGKMVEFGSHEELISKKGYYYSLVQAQFMNYEKGN